MTRIAIISIHSCPLAPLGGEERGGMNVYVREVSKELGRRGIGVDVFTRAKSPDLPKVVHLPENVRVVHLPAGKVEPYAKELVANHINEFTRGVLRFAASQEIYYDLLHGHYWLSGLVADKLRETWGIPFIQMFHTLSKLKNIASRGRLEKEPRRRVKAEQEIIKRADLVVAASALERIQMNRFYGASMEKIRVIPCGVDVNLFRPIPQEKARESLNLDHENILLFVGRIEPIKGLDTLIRALAILNNDRTMQNRPPKLLVVGGANSGNGDQPVPKEVARLKRIAGGLGIDKQIKFMGPLDQKELPYYYSAADVCVLPSYYESFGLVTLEAMACGTPMIASRVGGLPFTIKDGENGYLVTEGEPAELADKVKLVLTDEKEKLRLGDMGVNTTKEYGWETITSRLLSVYSELIELQPGGRELEEEPEEKIIHEHAKQ